MSSLHSLSKLLREKLDWRKQRVDTLVWLLTALIDQGTVKLWRLASVSPSEAKPASTLRRFERFFSSQHICWKWRAKLCWQLLGKPKRCDLIFDRTQWSLGKADINILVLASRTGRFTIPILWLVLPDRGVCSAHQCARLLKQFIALFGQNCISDVLADREFGTGPMVDMLLSCGVPFTIRVKSGLKVRFGEDKVMQLAMLCRKRGLKMRRSTQFRLFHQKHPGTFFVTCGFKHVNSDNQNTCHGCTDQIILLTNHGQRKSVERYRRRWCIETMFADLKSRGFNLEQSHMTEHSKIDLLLSLITIAYLWVCKAIGRTHQKPLIKSHGYKAESWFRFALNKARKLLRINPNIFMKMLCEPLKKIERVG